jgi:uncharacterized membrane protein YqaE (UPF0057 family)
MNRVLLIVLAIFLPPIAVLCKSGAGKDLLINIILCIFFWVPGIIHALWVVTKQRQVTVAMRFDLSPP